MKNSLSMLSIMSTALLILCTYHVDAQQNNQLPLAPSGPTGPIKVIQNPTPSNAESAAVIWSEDFSNGIPAGWTNSGFDGNGLPLANCNWEYRGTTTSPQNNIGSRGGFSASISPSALQSPTRANGFVIFDSDYLDNGGNSTNAGGGLAPAPHVGQLTTSSINLSGHAGILIKFNTFARVFYANLIVQYSLDNGITWPYADTVLSHVSLGINGSTANGDSVLVNASNYLANQPNVKLRFTFDGTPGNINGNGHFFWMIDDIEIRSLPAHQLNFVAHNGTPKTNLSFGFNQPQYGFLPLGQTRPIDFMANIQNFGTATQTNVHLKVDLIDSNNSISSSVTSSPSVSTLQAGQVATYSQLTTASWTPSSISNYKAVFSALSDSINGITNIPQTDTFDLAITDTVMSLDFGTNSNGIGTDNIGDDSSAIAVMYTLNNDMFVNSADIFLDPSTVAGGRIVVTVYDSAGFSFTNGFPGQPIAWFQDTITSSHIADGKIRAHFKNSFGFPLHLSTTSTNAYFVVVRMFSNGGANPISIMNDQTFVQPSSAALFYYTISNPRWYTGFLNSLIFNAPHIRLNGYSTCMSTQYLGTVTTSCPSWTGPSGNVYTSDGMYLVDTIPGNGTTTCGTLTIFNLDVNAEEDITDEFCTSYTLPSGNIVTMPGTYADTISNSMGCDSIINYTLNALVDVSVQQSWANLTVNQTGAQYQWLKCDSSGYTPLQGITSRVFVPTQNGSYACIITNQNCTDTTACYNYNSVGIDENADNQPVIFPIPAGQFISIEQFEMDKIEQIEFVDLTGRVLRTVASSDLDDRIDVSGLPNGIYMIRIQMKNGSVSSSTIPIQH